MQFSNNKHRILLCEAIEDLTVLSAKNTKDSHLLRIFVFINYVHLHHKDISGIYARCTAVDSSIRVQILGTLVLTKLPTLDPARAEEIYNNFLSYNVASFLYHITPHLVADIPTTLDLIKTKHDSLIYAVEHIFYIKQLAYEENITLSALYKQYLQNLPPDASPFDQAEFWSIYCSINTVSIPLKPVHTYQKSTNRLIFETPVKVCQLFSKEGESWEQQMKYVGEYLLDTDSQTISLKEGTHPGDNPARELAFKKICQLSGGMNLLNFLEYGYHHANQCDHPLEIGLVFTQARKTLYPTPNENDVLIFDPSPEFVRSWHKDAFLQQIKATFVFSNEYAALLYKLHFQDKSPSSSVFFDYTDWMNDYVSPNYEYPTAVFSFQCAMESPHIEDHLQKLSQSPKSLDVYILRPSHGHETCAMLAQRLKTPEILSVDLIPLGIPYDSKPSRKMFVHIRYSPSPKSQICYLFNYRLAQMNNRIFLYRDAKVSIYHDQVHSVHQTPRTLFRALLKEKGVTRYKLPESYEFCPELPIWYVTFKDGQVQSGQRFQAYFCNIPTDQQRKRNLLARGNRIKKTQKTNATIQDDTLSYWLEQGYVYKVRDLAIQHFAPQFAGQDISLKLFWYLHPQLQEYLDPDDYNIFLQMVYTPLGFVQLGSATHIFDDKISASFPDANQMALDNYWRILAQVLNLAVTLGYLSENILSPFYESYKKHGRNYMAEIRGALVKKTFSPKEMNTLLHAVHTHLNLGRMEYLAVLLRLVTGLKPSIISALSWNDFCRLPSYPVYQLTIRNHISSDGALSAIQVTDQIRDIPCIPMLRHALDSQYAMLKTLFPSKPISYLDQLPIVTTEAYLKDEAQIKTRLTAKEIQSLSQKVIDTLSIDSVYLGIPEESGGTKVINANDYRGDIFRSNYNYYLNQMRIDLDDQAFLLGNQRVTTFGDRYYNFFDEHSQFRIYKDLLLWNHQLIHTSLQLPVETHLQGITEAYLQLGQGGIGTIHIPHKNEYIHLSIASHYSFKSLIAIVEKSHVTTAKEVTHHDFHSS